MNKGEPKYKKGDVCLFVDPDFEDEPDDWREEMVITGDPFWYPYDNHPNKGYWLYPIKDKANECPEDLLKLKDNKN